MCMCCSFLELTRDNKGEYFQFITCMTYYAPIPLGGGIKR